ncbi:MAG TPA: TPM domain-containing protein, partial [Candidatus Methanoperedens sp.]
MKLKILQVIFLFLIFIHTAGAVDYPSSTGYVNDFANMLGQADKERLNIEITAIEKATTVEIAIVTVDSLQGVSVEEYAVKLFEKWGIGKKDKDNGLLILVAKNEREYRIETGYGLEGTINAARAGRIGREIIEPNFKNGEFGKGLYESVLEIKKLVENDPAVVAKYEASDRFDITI